MVIFLLKHLTNLIVSFGNTAPAQSIKIVKKSGSLLGSFHVSPKSTFGDLIAAVTNTVPASLLQTKFITLCNGIESSALQFAPNYLVVECLNSIKDTTVYLILQDIQQVEGFL
jgi:hypothetical protein